MANTEDIGTKTTEDFDRERFKSTAQELLNELYARILHAKESGDEEGARILTNLKYGIWQYAGGVYNGIDKIKKGG
jgi:hypothetical protein